MREILFRGKAANRKAERSYRTKYKNGDWVYGLLTDAENFAGFAEMTNTNGVSGIEVDKNTVGQFTGLTDKNGKKIFEGDVLCRENVNGYVLYSTEFCKFVFCWKRYDKHRPDHFKECGLTDYARFRDLEIIGNIHDNPELLETA